MPSEQKRYFIAGVDEAGYGPRLGPLVISAVVFETPRRGGCLWEELRPVVSKRFSRNTDSLPVGDSKKIFSTKRGIVSLEKTVLAFCPPEVMPTRLYDLLGELAPSDYEPEGPWYDAADTTIPAGAEQGEIERLQANLREKMRSAGVALRRAYTLPIHPCRMNRALSGTGDVREKSAHQGGDCTDSRTLWTPVNKSVLLFEETLSLIKRLLEEFGSHDLEIVADKQGGRHYYGPLLAQAFPMARLDALREGPEESVYFIEAPSGRARLSFRKSGESGCLPVALASMFSKYIRELFMAAFNRYWQRRQPGLRRTSGYPVDAARFLKDIAPRLDEMNVDRQILVRTR
ncbi:MAG: hypothetical protein ABIH04_05005 [Planctomycetota bacterium]